MTTTLTKVSLSQKTRETEKETFLNGRFFFKLVTPRTKKKIRQKIKQEHFSKTLQQLQLQTSFVWCNDFFRLGPKKVVKDAFEFFFFANIISEIYWPRVYAFPKKVIPKTVMLAFSFSSSGWHFFNQPLAVRRPYDKSVYLATMYSIFWIPFTIYLLHDTYCVSKS